MEFIKCYCGSKNIELFVRRNEIRFECYGFDKEIYRCKECGLIQLLPQWTEEELKVLYDKYSQKKDFETQKERKEINYNVLTYLPLSRQSRILEIGCGRGYTLNYLKKIGYKNVFGVEKDNSIKGENIINCDFFDLKGKEKYDFIYAIHVMEHVMDPLRFIREIIDLLKRDGMFFLEIPCVNDPLLSIYKNKSYNKFYWYPYHMFFFRKEDIEFLLFQTKSIMYTVKYYQRYGLYNHLRWFFLRKPGNINFKFPIIDDIYSFFLKRKGFCDTMLIVGKKSEQSYFYYR